MANGHLSWWMAHLWLDLQETVHLVAVVGVGWALQYWSMTEEGHIEFD